MATTLGTNNITFNDGTIQKSASSPPGEVTISLGGSITVVNLSNTAITNTSILTFSTTDNSITKRAYEEGKPLVITRVIMYTSLQSSNSSTTVLSSTHCMNFMLEASGDNSTYHKVASSYDRHDLGTYYGTSLYIPPHQHICVVANPNGSNYAWHSSLTSAVPDKTGTTVDTRGFTLTSNTFYFRMTGFSTSIDQNLFLSSYTDSSGTRSRQSPDGSGFLRVDSALNDTKGIRTIANLNTNSQQYPYIRIQSLPTTYVNWDEFRIDNTTSINASRGVTCTGGLSYSVRALVSMGINTSQ